MILYYLGIILAIIGVMWHTDPDTSPFPEAPGTITIIGFALVIISMLT